MGRFPPPSSRGAPRPPPGAPAVEAREDSGWRAGAQARSPPAPGVWPGAPLWSSWSGGGDGPALALIGRPPPRRGPPTPHLPRPAPPCRPAGTGWMDGPPPTHPALPPPRRNLATSPLAEGAARCRWCWTQTTRVPPDDDGLTFFPLLAVCWEGREVSPQQEGAAGGGRRGQRQAGGCQAGEPTA